MPRNGTVGRPGKKREDQQNAAGQQQRLRVAEELLAEIGAQALVGTGARDDQAAGDGDHQRRNHGHQAVADGQDGIGFDGVAQIHAMLQNADQKAGDDVDAGDQNAGHGIALREARCAVHGAVEFGFLGQILAAPARASFSSIRPELRSESMDICLPGRASRVKRAVTSEMRTAPWLMTTYWMAISTRKMTAPMM